MATKAATKTAAVKVETVSTRQLASQLAEKHELSQKSANAMLEDTIGLALLAPAANWRERGDMNPQFTRPFRASIVARARFIEDLVVEEVDRGVTQYVILGAGLDSFAQRRPEIAARLHIFEVDPPGPQAWKRRRLIELGYGVSERLHFVPVDFEEGESWREKLVKNGFDQSRPAIVVSTGVV